MPVIDRDLHLDVLGCLWDLMPPLHPKRVSIGKRIGRSAALSQEADIPGWTISLDASFCSKIMGLARLNIDPDAIRFMHSIGCLAGSEGQLPTIHTLLVLPALMGDLAGLKYLQDVITAHVARGKVLLMAHSHRKRLVPGSCLFVTHLAYWKIREGGPEYSAVGEWLLDHVTHEQQGHLWKRLYEREGCLLAVEMQACTPDRYPPRIFWNAATHHYAAAHVDPPALKWLLEQRVSAPEYTLVHDDCCDACLLLLVHGHHWRLPAGLTAAESRRLAFYGAAKHQRK